MAKKAKPSGTLPRGKRALGKRASAFKAKLALLRKVSDEFDAKSLDTLYTVKPRTAKGKRARAAALDRVARTFKRLRPFVDRPHQLVRLRDKKKIAALKKYVGFGNFKGIRAIPVPTENKQNLRVKFDRSRRVEIHYQWPKGVRSELQTSYRIYALPHKPRDGDDLIAMTEQMVKSLPDGFYVIMTRHNFLIPSASDRDSLARTMRSYVYQYGRAVEFLRLIYGFKLILEGDDPNAVLKKMKELRDERNNRKALAKRLKHERIARELAAMQRTFKRGKVSKRARATGRR